MGMLWSWHGGVRGQVDRVRWSQRQKRKEERSYHDTFLLQCQLAFHSHPQQYVMDSAKVFFAISYLKKSALEWLESGVMEPDLARVPRWCSSWADFTLEICTHFGPVNPVWNAEIELHHLSMSYNS